jgi:hypothetical protein
MHFHHVSIAMTEGGYVGRDPALLDELDSARSQMTALGMYEIAHGQMSLKNMGPAGDQVRNTIYETLRPRIEGQSESVAWRETIRFQEEFGAVFSFSPYATCAAYMLPEMRCHEEAGTMVLARWRHNLQPNYQSRRPELCGDCPNAMFDRRHRPFWVSRYATNKRAVEERRYRNDTAGLRVFEANMLQARNVLRQMGEDVEALDSFIDAGMDPTREVYDG